MENPSKRLGVIPLAALVVSAMIGGGIFSLPQNMAQNASAGAIIIAWLITGCGIFFLANTFRILSVLKPEATTGIYTYARLGFGRFAGFQMAWSYWLCNVFGNVAYAVLLMDAFDYFFPGVFTNGNNLWSILGGSVIIWLMNFAVLRGVKQAVILNVAGTIFKLLPILLFILILLYVFRFSEFTVDFWGTEHITLDKLKPLGNLSDQVKSTMLVTLWAFIGIEGAVVISGRAKKSSDVGKATLLGFAGCLTIYFLLSLLPFGRMPRTEIAMLQNPSTAPLLAEVVKGAWGGWIMNLGVVVALLTSWLAFTIMIAQIPYAAAVDGTFPKIFQRENKRESPNVSLWVTSSLMQLTMIFVYFANDAWNTMLSVTTVMILPPYLACTAYLWKLCSGTGDPALDQLPNSRGFVWFCGFLGSMYAVWMIYAAGLTYLLMAFVFLLLGIPVYLWAVYDRRKEQIRQHVDRKKLDVYFTKKEAFCAVMITLIAGIAVVLWSMGKIHL